jgi:hypothetical protein
MSGSMLAPAAALVLWSMIMMLWMLVTRGPELSKVRNRVGSLAPGGRYQDIEKLIPDRVNWKSHNYTHLMEQPTVFYPAVIILHLAGATTTVNLALAWTYVGLRVVHSIWQATVNRIPVRIALFATSSFALVALAVNAVRTTLGA